MYPLNNDEKDDIKLSINLNKNLKAPIKKGQILGDVDVFLNGMLIRKDNLLAKYNIDKNHS